MSYLISSGLIWILLSLALFVVIYFITIVATNQSKTDIPQEIKDTPCEERQKEDKETRVREFWIHAHQIARDYTQNNELDLLNEFVYNLWTTRDHEESAEDLHNLFGVIIFHFYSHRHDTERHYAFLNTVCDLDISNVHNYAKKNARTRAFLLMPSFTKKAIMLEQEGRIEEAIEICNLANMYNVYDEGYRSCGFEQRRTRLLSKLKNK